MTEKKTGMENPQLFDRIFDITLLDGVEGLDNQWQWNIKKIVTE